MIVPPAERLGYWGIGKCVNWYGLTSNAQLLGSHAHGLVTTVKRPGDYC